MTAYYVKAPSGTAGAGTYRGRHVVSTTWATGDRVVPTNAYGTAAAKGYVYECTTAGAGGGAQPTWVYTTPDTSTTTDGAAVWTCRNATTWANSSTVPEHLITNKMAAGDILYQENVLITETTTQTLSFPGTLASPMQWISTSDTTNMPPTSVATGAGLDLSATSAISIITNTGTGYLYGVTLKTGGSTGAGQIYLLNSVATALILDSCALTIPNTNSGTFMRIGVPSSANRVYLKTINCTFTTGNNAGQRLNVYSNWDSSGDTFAITTTVPTKLFANSADGFGGSITMMGADLSAINTTMVDLSSSTLDAVFTQCKVASGVAFASATSPGSGDVWVNDCASGDTHYEFGHYNYYGSTTISTAIYVTADGASYDGTNRHSWKITGTANSSFLSPYVSPPIPVYNAGVAAKTPYLEVLRDGSTTAYNDDQVWSEWFVKITASSTRVTLDRSDKRGVVATASAQTASALTTSDWTGDTTAWFGKLSPTASITPAEIGDVSVTVSVAGAITLYVDPQIRGL